MNVLRLESRVAGVVDYLARLKVAMSRIDTALWPGATLQNDLESLMTRLNEIPSRVQEWKKSSARCGAYVALSLVRVHARKREKRSWQRSRLPIPRSMTSNLSWRPSLLLPLGLPTESTWTNSSSLPALLPRSEQTFMPHLKFSSECRVIL